MLYLDHDYKNDCEHKIEYDKLELLYDQNEDSVSDLESVTTAIGISNVSNVGQIYKSTDDVYLIKTTGNNSALSLIMPNENCSIIEIAPGIYKLIVYTV